MAREKITVEMYACINAEGEYDVGTTAEEARERYEENIGALSEAEGFRIVKASIALVPPMVTELSGAVADDEEQPALTEVSQS